MPMVKCMEEMTVLERDSWIIRIEKEMENPSRSDWYLMQNSTEIKAIRLGLLGVNFSSLKIEDMKLTRPKPKEKIPAKQDQLNRDKATAAAQAVYAARLGGIPKDLKVTHAKSSIPLSG